MGPDPTLAPPAPATGITTLAAAGGDDWLPPPTENNGDDYGTGPCASLKRSYQVKRYEGVQVWGTMPLRCGYHDGAADRGLGFAKMVEKGRWNPWCDGMIGATIQNPADIKHSGTSVRYISQWFPQCNPPYKFVVVTESRDYGG
jgi:hypothetical protein